MSKRRKNKKLEVSPNTSELIRELKKYKQSNSWSSAYMEYSKEAAELSKEADWVKYTWGTQPNYPGAIVLPEPEKPKYPSELSEFIEDYMNKLKDDLCPFLYEFLQKPYGSSSYGIIIEFVTLRGYKFLQIVELNIREKYFTAEIEKHIIENIISAIALRTRTSDEIKARAVI